MKIFVKAKPGAKISKIVQKDSLHFEVWVKEKPEGGKANEALRQALADYFDCPQSKITLLKGGSSRNKVFGIEA